ncbi:MAG: putative Ig domain-containing protein, partial [Acidobacteriota bacterium]|nr:putative Ig domain-containing protein [Acidobacteriota bacterium]
IVVNPAPSCDPTLSPSSGTNFVATEGTTFTQTIAATDLNNPSTTFTFSVQGNLPPGLSTSQSANLLTISGTPTLAGSYSFSVTASATSCTITGSYSIEVLSSSTSCNAEFTPAAGGTFRGNVGEPFSQSITVTDANSPFRSFQLEVSNLPRGLTASSTTNRVTISGIPQQAGNFPLYITATSSGCTAIANYTLQIGGTSCPETTFSPPESKLTLDNGSSVDLFVFYDGQPATGATIQVSVSPRSDFDVFDVAPGPSSGSVRVTLAVKGNASEYTLTITATRGGCTASRTYSLEFRKPAAELIVTPSVNFGSVDLGVQVSSEIRAFNPSTSIPVEITSVGFMGEAGDFRLEGSLVGTLAPQASTRMNIILRPTRLGPASATVLVQSSAGNRTVALSANSRDTSPPVVLITAPRGNNAFTSGQSVLIEFSGTDNDRVEGYNISAVLQRPASAISPATTQTLPIANLDGDATNALWIVPEVSGQVLGSILVRAFDPSGNSSSATSGTFQIQGSQSDRLLQVTLTFEPPPAGQIAPPQNLRVIATEVKRQSTENEDTNANSSSVTLTGYNVYRAPQPPPGAPLPKPEQIIKNGAHVGAAAATATSFSETISAAQGDNFVYTVTSTFGSGQQSEGATPAATDLPVIKNPRYSKGALLMDLANSYIKQGAVLIVDEKEEFTLSVDSSGILWTVSKSQKSKPGNLTIKKAIPEGKTVTLKVKNPDGKLSLGVSFKR